MVQKLKYNLSGNISILYISSWESTVINCNKNRIFISQETTATTDFLEEIGKHVLWHRTLICFLSNKLSSAGVFISSSHLIILPKTAELNFAQHNCDWLLNQFSTFIVQVVSLLSSSLEGQNLRSAWVNLGNNAVSCVQLPISRPQSPLFVSNLE